MNANIVPGATLATAAIALALNGAFMTPTTAKKAPKTIHCMGVNSCKGASSRKTASNSCKGLSFCKGQGWLPAKSKAECELNGGAVGGSTSKTDG